MADAERLAWLRLTLTPGVGPVTARRLLAAFGLPASIWAQSATALAAVVGPKAVQALLAEPPDLHAQDRLTREWLEAGDAAGPARRLLSLADPDYPPSLLETDDPPLLLYVQGDLGALLHPRPVGVVGSRNPTPQGLANAQAFGQALAEAGVCVVSGLALGVDGAAHLGALNGGGPTVAVVGTGLDRVYPSQHRALAHRIAEHGALLSELPIGTPPVAANFPRRNRLIAGLSRGTLVVEAALQSGSLITARLASEMGRDVFAIPGSIHAPQSRGCHALIKQGAKLVESAQDILEELGLAAANSPGTGPTAARAVTPAESETTGANASPLLSAMGFEPVSFDALQARCGLDTASLQARLLELELDGSVGRLPGGLFQRMGQA